MKREPSIHITESNFNKVLFEIWSGYFVSANIKINKELFDKEVEKIIINCRKYSLSNRSIKVDNAKLLKSTSRVVLSTLGDTAFFCNRLQLVRRQLKHRGISLIKVNSSDWLQCKEITKLANEFCENFDLKKEEGFTKFIRIGLEKMNKFSLYKFNSLSQTISETYIAELDLSEDITPQETLRGWNTYQAIVMEKTGTCMDYRSQPEKYVFFLKAKEEAIKIKVDIEHYIKGQFHGMEWRNAIPDPAQLVGPKAIERVTRYLSEKQIKVNEKPKVKINWKAIKRK